GIVCFVREDGQLNGYAVDKYGRRYESHPDTGLSFGEGSTIPEFARLTELTKLLASRIPMNRLAGWDMCLDRERAWRCLEVNLRGHTIRFAQYAGQPFFAEFTDEVVHYCLSHPRFQLATVRLY